MKKVLLVIDMQNDFIDGALGTPEATAIVPIVKRKIQSFDGMVIFTRDTHFENYLETAEGAKLPVKHCIKDSRGWEISPELAGFKNDKIIDKPSFGSVELGEFLLEIDQKEGIESITLIGLCTDICVISNALICKAFLPEIPVFVDGKCCAGVTPESHENALKAMEMCQINVER